MTTVQVVPTTNVTTEFVGTQTRARERNVFQEDVKIISACLARAEIISYVVGVAVGVVVGYWVWVLVLALVLGGVIVNVDVGVNV